MINGHSRQQPFGQRKPVDGLPWGVGVPIILVMSVSVFASIWFGWRIDKDLGELALNRQGFAVETARNRELIARRDNLLAKESVIKKAAVLGLFPPTAKQIRKIK